MPCWAKLSTGAARTTPHPRLNHGRRSRRPSRLPHLSRLPYLSRLSPLLPYLLSAAVFLLLSFLQSPGLIVADTKHNLTANPSGFLSQALHLWSENAPMGQLQNQAYGYFFPQGAFFVLGDALGIAPWVTQRLWWALLLWVGFWGFVHVARALGVGSTARVAGSLSTGNGRAAGDGRWLSWPLVAGGVAYALSPRVLTTLGAISSETLPVMLAPWVLLPVVLAFPTHSKGHPSSAQPRSHAELRTYALWSAVAVACMGAINAVATLAAITPALVWWVTHLPLPTRNPELRTTRRKELRNWAVFTGWWLVGGILACLWWIGPLLILGKYSPPFLEFIESAGVTTCWSNLAETLRGTTSWTPFVSGERVAGAALVSEPVFVLATMAVAAAGLAGLTLRSMRHRPRLIGMLLLGVTIICLPWVGDLGVPFAEQVRSFLDGAGSAFRNLHKFDPLIRLPLSLGVAQLLSRVPLPEPRAQLAHLERWPRVAGGVAVVLALVVGIAPAWSFRLAPAGGYKEVPDHWTATAAWLENHPEGRALIVPGSNFARQIWGLTRDEPLQPLANTPWAVRDIIPLVPPETIRALDSVQELFADGRASAGLADTLAAQNIRHLIVRNDLDLEATGAASPQRVHNTLRHSPGLRRVTSFGKTLRNGFRAVDIYVVEADFPAGPWLVDADELPVIAGGPEAVEPLAALARSRGTQFAPVTHIAPLTMLAGDTIGTSAGGGLTVTDSPTLREVDFGSLDHHASALRSRRAERHTDSRLADYPTDVWAGSGDGDGAGTTAATYARWYGATVTSSSSASHADQLRYVQPAYSEAAAVDGDPHTSWRSLTLQGAVGQWLQLNLHKPLRDGTIAFTIPRDLPGAKVSRVAVVTEQGSTTVSVRPGQRMSTPLPPGETSWVRIVAVATTDGSAGVQFGLSDVSVRDGATGRPVAIGRQIVVPAPSDTALSTPHGAVFPARWVLHQRFPGSVYLPQNADRTSKDAKHRKGTAGSRAGSRADYPADAMPISPAEEGNRLVRVVTVPELPSTDTAGPPQVQPTVLVRWNPYYGAAVGSTKKSRKKFEKSLEEGLARLPAGCSTTPESGLSLRVGETRIPLRLVGSAENIREALRNGQAVRAEPCTAATLPLPTGQEVLVEAQAGNLPLAIDTVELRVVNQTGSRDLPTFMPRPAQKLAWGDTFRKVTVPRSTHQQLLVVPESANPGWVARIKGANGATLLEPTVANGWQQAWIVPAGYAGPVELEFTPDKPYRAFLLAGLIALVLLFAGAVFSQVMLRRRTKHLLASPVSGESHLWASQPYESQPWESSTAAGDGSARGRIRYLPLAVVSLVMFAGIMLAHQPWGSLTGYAGNRWYVQLPMLVALVLAALSPWLEGWLRSEWVTRLRARWRRFSQRL